METRHPAGDEIKTFVLLTDGVCVSLELLDGEMGNISPRIVQLYFPEGERPPDLMARATETVTFRGELMEPHTAWHIGDLVMLNAKLSTE